MQTVYYSAFIKAFILAERSVNTQFRKSTQLNHTEIEVLTFAAESLTFNIYQVQKHFNHTNVQIIRRTTKSLLKANLIECVGRGGGQKASVYMITRKGKQSFNEYIEKWMAILV